MSAQREANVVELEVRLDAPPEEVFRYLVDPERYVQWQGVRAELDPRPGGVFRVWMDANTVASGEYVAVEAPDRVVFTWGWEGNEEIPPGSTRVELSLRADGDQTVLTLRHEGLPDEAAALMHREGWSSFVDRLRLVVRGEDPGPMSMRPAEEHEEAGELSEMRVDVETQIEIDRPRPEVAAYASDPDNATTWYENIEAVEWKSPKPLAVGSKIAFVAHFLGRRLGYTYQVDEMVPDARFVMRTAEGPFPMETTYTWKDTADGGTTMTLRNRGEPSGFAKLAAPMMARAMRRANQKDLARLKAVLEATPRN